MSNGEFWRQAWHASILPLTEGSLCQTENSGARPGMGASPFDRGIPLSNGEFCRQAWDLEISLQTETIPYQTHNPREAFQRRHSFCALLSGESL